MRGLICYKRIKVFATSELGRLGYETNIHQISDMRSTGWPDVMADYFFIFAQLDIERVLWEHSIRE